MGTFSGTVNIEYINRLKKKIEDIEDCSELQKVMNKIDSELNQYIQDAVAQIALLKGLLINPTDLGAVIGWINNMIKLISLPYSHSIAAQIALVEKYAELIEAIAEVSTTLKCNLVIPETPTIPGAPTIPNS